MDSGSQFIELGQLKLLAYVILAFFTFGAIHKVVKNAIWVYHVRRGYKDIVSFPRHWLLGNLMQVGQRLNPTRRHPDYGIEELWNQLGQPSAFLIDIAPLAIPVLVVSDPAIGEQVVQPTERYKYSYPKSRDIHALTRLVGKESLIVSEGEVWRFLRKRFSKGFSQGHLYSLSPLVVSKTRIFTDRLIASARSQTTFRLKSYTHDLATDIITTIALEKDWGSQSIPDGQGPKSKFGFLTALHQSSTYAPKAGQEFYPSEFLNLIRPVYSWFYEKLVNWELDKSIWKSFEEDREKSSAKAVVQLALAGMTPTRDLVRNTRSQIKTFIFAGQDTTATTIQWMCYELSKVVFSPKHQAMLRKLEEEHEVVFGPGPFSALDVLERPGQTEQIFGSRIPYTTAFIKEVLRLHPPAATGRLGRDPKDSSPHELEIDGRMVRVDGIRIYVDQWIMHRNPKIWGDDAAEFRPERWLGEEYMRKIPTGAFRPFERGPRSCIGQELAMLELKATLCALARGIAFEKMGQTGRNGDREVFNIFNVTSTPSDGMMMRVHLR